MAMNARLGKAPHRRVSFYLPVHVGTFLDLICKYGLKRKSALVEEVWSAGMLEVFGMTPEEILECSLRIPAVVSGAEDLELCELAALLCGTKE